MEISDGYTDLYRSGKGLILYPPGGGGVPPEVSEISDFETILSEIRSKLSEIVDFDVLSELRNAL